MVTSTINSLKGRLVFKLLAASKARQPQGRLRRLLGAVVGDAGGAGGSEARALVAKQGYLYP